MSQSLRGWKAVSSPCFGSYCFGLRALGWIPVFKSSHIFSLPQQHTTANRGWAKHPSPAQMRMRVQDRCVPTLCSQHKDLPGFNGSWMD